MKKILFTFIAIAFAMTTLAQQLTLLHTFDERTLNGVYPYFGYHQNDYSYANSGDSYIYIDETVNEQGYYSVEKDTLNYTYTYIKYNNDFTVKSKKVYNIPRVENYNLDWVNLYYAEFNLIMQQIASVCIIVYSFVL